MSTGLPTLRTLKKEGPLKLAQFLFHARMKSAVPFSFANAIP